MSLLLGVLDGARLADDRDLDLARVGQLLLDLLDDVAGEAASRSGRRSPRADEDPDLAAGLDRERALDAAEALGDRLQVLEALDVVSIDSPRAPGRDALIASAIWTIGASRQVYSTSWWCAAIALITLGDRLWRWAIWRADGGVRTLDLVVDRLADVVQQAAHLGDLHVCPISAAMIAARWLVSTTCFSTFWP